MQDPIASRPYMPGYGVRGPGEGSGLLPWSWADARLESSRNYWLVSICPDGSPNAMPVWGVWHDRSFWFCSSAPSRKARNLRTNPRCTVTTEDTTNPVVVTGRAELITDARALAGYLGHENSKYGTEYGIETLDPHVNVTFCVHPEWAFGLRADDFTGSPARWSFE